MSPTIINHEQSEYWNKKYGHKWVDNDNSMNERLTILTKALFLKTNIEMGDKVLDIGCGGGQTSFEASQLVGENGCVLGADISNLLLDLAKSKYSKIKNLVIILLIQILLRPVPLIFLQHRTYTLYNLWLHHEHQILLHIFFQ